MTKQAKVQKTYTVTLKDPQYGHKTTYEVGMLIETDYTPASYSGEAKLYGTLKLRFYRREMYDGKPSGSWAELGLLTAQCSYEPYDPAKRKITNYFQPGNEWKWDSPRKQHLKDAKAAHDNHDWGAWYGIKFEDFGTGLYGGPTTQFQAAEIISQVYDKAEKYAQYRNLNHRYEDGISWLIFALTALNVTPLQQGESYWVREERYTPYFRVDQV